MVKDYGAVCVCSQLRSSISASWTRHAACRICEDLEDRLATLVADFDEARIVV